MTYKDTVGDKGKCVTTKYNSLPNDRKARRAWLTKYLAECAALAAEKNRLAQESESKRLKDLIYDTMENNHYLVAKPAEGGQSTVQ